MALFVNRSFSASIVTVLRRPNPALAWVLLAVSAMLGVTVAAGLALLVALEVVKPFWRARLQS